MADDRRIDVTKGGHIPGTPTLEQLFSHQTYPDLNLENRLEDEVVRLYEEMLDLDAKLNNKNTYEKSFVTEFKKRVSKIGKRNLQDLHTKLSGVVEVKRQEYREKVEREENEAYQSLLNDFFDMEKINSMNTASYGTPFRR